MLVLKNFIQNIQIHRPKKLNLVLVFKMTTDFNFHFSQSQSRFSVLNAVVSVDLNLLMQKLKCEVFKRHLHAIASHIKDTGIYYLVMNQFKAIQVIF